MDQEVDIYEKFRYNLRLLREAKGLTASAASHELGWTKHRMIDLEYGKFNRGMPKLVELTSLCSFFGVSLDDLVHKKARIIFE